MYVFVLVMYLQANEVYKTLEKGPNVQSLLQISQLLKQKTTIIPTPAPRNQPPKKNPQNCWTF